MLPERTNESRHSCQPHQLKKILQSPMINTETSRNDEQRDTTSLLFSI